MFSDSPPFSRRTRFGSGEGGAAPVDPGRRAFLAAAGALAFAPPRLLAQEAAAAPFGFEDVAAQARALADEAHRPSRTDLRPPFADLSYDRYRAIRFREEARLLGGDGAFAVDLLPPGHVYRQRVDIAVVRRSGVQQVAFSPAFFDFDPAHFDFPDGRAPADVGEGHFFSGFRLRHPINRPDVFDEFAVFQGASYFRAIARNMNYGLSARGLAISTADPRGEEFPAFTKFWIHEPEPDARDILVHALLDSPSCAGAFEFEIHPGDTTLMETRCVLFPRTTIDQAGIAPLTSMYYFGPLRRAGVDDFRDAVHDSSGLQMVSGDGVRRWRPLTNPARVQFSAFADENPKGFGLTQRRREFEFYQDDEARYDRRPSAWVEPLGAWGKGAVVLVEIPVENEFNDNIVAFWRPDAPLEPRAEGHEFAYRLHWCAEPPDAAPVARVAGTRGGVSIHEADRRVFVVDFRKGEHDRDELTPEVWASAGAVGPVDLRDLPGGEKMRASFLFKPGDADVAELGLTLKAPDGPASEIWLHRWTAR